MDLNEADKIIVMFMDKYNLRTQGWSYRWARSFNRLGQCDYRRKELNFSKYWTQRHTLDEFTDTVLHEIAHALTPGDDHGKRWKSVAIKIGGTGKVTAEVALRPEEYPWHAKCLNGHRTWAINKPRDIERAMCNKCYKEKNIYVPYSWKNNGVPYQTKAMRAATVDGTITPVDAQRIFSEIQARTISPAASRARVEARKPKPKPKVGGQGGRYAQGSSDPRELWG